MKKVFVVLLVVVFVLSTASMAFANPICITLRNADRTEIKIDKKVDLEIKDVRNDPKIDQRASIDNRADARSGNASAQMRDPEVESDLGDASNKLANVAISGAAKAKAVSKNNWITQYQTVDASLNLKTKIDM